MGFLCSMEMEGDEREERGREGGRKGKRGEETRGKREREERRKRGVIVRVRERKGEEEKDGQTVIRRKERYR